MFTSPLFCCLRIIRLLSRLWFPIEMKAECKYEKFLISFLKNTRVLELQPCVSMVYVALTRFLKSAGVQPRSSCSRVFLKWNLFHKYPQPKIVWNVLLNMLFSATFTTFLIVLTFVERILFRLIIHIFLATVCFMWLYANMFSKFKMIK